MNKFRIRINIKKALLLILIAMFLLIFSSLWQETGIFQKSKIDSRDKSYWSYDSEGYIIGAREFSLNGSKENCWILVHSYTATPLEMKELAISINSEFKEYVSVPLLEGHSQTPSKLIGKNNSIWYNQIDKEIYSLSKECKNISLVGSSISAPIVLRLAEEKEFKSIYILNSFIKMPYKPSRVLPLRTYVNIFTPIVHYNKKTEIAQIKSEEGKKVHVAYWNMPYLPVKGSFAFIDEVELSLFKIKEPIFIGHSHNDPTADGKGAELVYNSVSSEIREIRWYDNSEHVLLLDNDKNKIIKDIINFSRSLNEKK